MSASAPARRLGQSVLAFRSRAACSVPSRTFCATAQRYASTDGGKEPNLRNPILDNVLAKQAKEKKKDDGQPKRPALREGTLSDSSLFRPERELPGWRPDMPPQEEKRLKEEARLRIEEAERQETRRLTSMNTDPDIEARRELERKLIIAGVERRGRLTKAQVIARTERQSLFKSKALPTSTKKLQKVVNQIAGKTVSEALVQLRFSKKKVARDVIKGLEIAHNEAVASRGMGLGESKSALQQWHAQRAAEDAGKSKDSWNYRTLPEDPKSIKDGKAVSDFQKQRRGATITLKDGSKKIVKDPTEIYIDQAWVGPGEHWKSPEFRARGAVNMLKHRTTSFSVLLKEEKTRVRLSDEMKKKRDNRKLWVALPDRPVTSQRQYCLW